MKTFSTRHPAALFCLGALLLFSLISSALAQTTPLRTLSSSRYTDLGSDRVKVEIGELTVDNGFIPTSIFESFRAQLALTEATLRDVNKKFLVRADQVDALKAIDPKLVSLYRFSSTEYSVSGFLMVTARVYDGTTDSKPKVVVRANKAYVTEAPSETVVFKVLLDKNAKKDLRVHFKFTGSATLNTDYKTSATKSVVVKEGSKSAQITVRTLNNNNASEGRESIICRLIADSAYTLDNPDSASVSLRDDD